MDTLIEKIKFVEAEIIDQYLNDESPRPWIVGFSGGKDSTMLLQLVWYAIKKIPHEKRTREIYLVCNDTLVENPKIVDFIGTVLAKVKNAAQVQGLPITVHQTTPTLEESFWVNVVGRGYPAPNKIFRWCTERLKINPTTRFILDKVSESGEVIILLGTRSNESINRARSMKKYTIGNQRLRKHLLNNAYVFAPISDFLTEEVWQYLSSVPAPWGGNHHQLITLYRNASGGDCPLVIDTTTPSCGTSRFGCWVCTVVNKDKSMQALIDNGEEWMTPLIEIRDYLVETRDNPERYRSKTRRDGTEKEGMWGPYLPKTRYIILEKILRAQLEIQQIEPLIELISQQELVAIQVLWLRDNHFAFFDKQTFKVSALYNKIYNRTIEMNQYSLKNQKLEDDTLLKICEEKFGRKNDFDLLKDLLEIQKTNSFLKKKTGSNTFNARLEKELTS